jgi:autotransporter-associated beta strand protein
METEPCKPISVMRTLRRGRADSPNDFSGGPFRHTTSYSISPVRVACAHPNSPLCSLIHLQKASFLSASLMSYKIPYSLVSGLIVFLLQLSLHGEGVMLSTTADAAGTYDSSTALYQSLRQDDTSINVGRQGANAIYHQAAVFPFQLPNLGLVANPFQNAEFSFRLNAKDSVSTFNADLYGLPVRTSSTVVPATASATNAGDFFMGGFAGGPADDPTPGVTKIQNNILIPNSNLGLITTNPSGSAQLAAYLNAAYDSGNGVGKWVFLRLSTDALPSGAHRYNVSTTENTTSANRPRIRYNFEPEPNPFSRPFIWVRNSEKAGIVTKIANNPWATSVYNGMISRVGTALASHQSDRDAFLRQIPVEWTLSPAKFKTIPAYSENSVRYSAETKFNNALDCAVLYYLTGDENYARCAADILHNSVKTLLPVAASTSVGNGGWIFQTDFLKEARVTGTQLAIVYDFLRSYLETNQVYDVQTAGMVNFNFTTAQSVFRKLYQLARDHGQRESNWSALMATTMLNNLLALDDEAERAAALQVYLTTGTSRQASLQYDYRHYSQTGNIWPESLQYASAVGNIRTTHMVLLERYDPTLTLFNTYPNLPLSLPRVSQLRYPNGQQISFGDGFRAGSNGPFFVYELVYQHALARGRTDLTSYFGSLINGGVAEGNYNRSSPRNYSTLGLQNEPLQLLWQAAVISEPAVTPELPRTDRLPFAGVALQRNPAPTDNSNFGLMAFVGGAAHVHSHASGMSMELFGMGQVLGAKSGRTSYGTTDHENYYRLFASNNTVIVNGGSRGLGGWQDIGINTVQTVTMEPQPFAQAVSPNHSFTTSSFVDDKGTLAQGTQQRTMAIVRTSPTSGFYVDFFRTRSTVTNRTATTLNGNVTNQYHDYIYRNVGNLNPEVQVDGAPATFVSQANRFQNDIGDSYQQPGWRYFTDTVVTHPATQSMRARFVATVSGQDRCMTMHMPAVASREIARVSSPAIVDAPSPYSSARAPALVIRQIGDAWDKPFATVYEPHFGTTGGTVQNVTQLLRGNIVVGVKVESTVGQKNLVHYILSNPAAQETYTNTAAGLSFTGRFGIAADNGDGTTTLYLGQGSSMSYRGNSVATANGSASQAEVRFTPGQAPQVTSNTAVNVVSAPPPAGFSWVPTAGGTGYDWNQAANWNPATIPNEAGGIAYKNNNITGDQTVNLNIPVTLGELVIGDSSGSENTLLQKGSNGSLGFDQTENGVAYLTRSAGGTGTVTFASDLNLTLNDNLTVRQAGGAADSTMVIAGILAGPNKGLAKEGGSLTLSLAGANTYSGATRIAGGILSLDHSLAMQNSALDTVNSVAGDATNGLRTTVTSLTLGGLLGTTDLSSVFTSTSGGYSGVTALTLRPGTGALFDYTGVIADGALGMSLTKSGAGTQMISGINTYTGNTSLAPDSGTLAIGGNGRLGNGNYSGSISIGNGSTFAYSSSAAQTFSGPLSGSGSFEKSGNSMLTLSGSNASFTGSLALSAGTLTLANTNALSGASAISISGTPSIRTSVQNATLNASVSLSGNPSIHAPDFGTGSTVSTLTLNGAISGAGNLTLSSASTVASNSNQTIRLNAQSSYTGSTTLNPTGNDSNLIVRLGIANALPPTTVLSINGAAAGGGGRFARLDLGGFNQTIGGLQNTTASQRSQQIINSAATAATLTINNPSDHTFSGNINGSNLSLVKSGAGTQTFSGTNTFTGTTTLNSGKLRGVVGGHFSNSSLTLAHAAATLGVVINDNTKTWTCAALTTSAAGNLEFDFGSTPPDSVAPLTVTGLASFSTSPMVRVITGTGIAPGNYPLMTWGSTSGTAPSVVQVLNPGGTGGLADGTSASLTVTGNTLNLVIVGVPVAVKANNTNNLNLGTSWVGGAAPNAVTTATWNNTVTTANTTVLGADVTWAGISITNPGGAVTINAGNTLTLGANANDINMSSATANLTLNCPLTLGDANVWNVAAGRTLTLAGVVSGAFSVTKEGAGTALLSASNDYVGSTTLAANSGTFEIGGSGRLGNGTYAAAIEIGSNSTFRYNSSSAQTLNGPISGSGTLVKSASSTLTLGGNNTEFTGPIALNAGTLNLGSVDALGEASSITIAGGAALSTQVTGINTSVPINLGAAATTSIISFSRNTGAQGTMTLNGLISGGANLTFTTPNVISGGNMQTIWLGSANTYAGNTTITSGNTNNSTTIRAGTGDSLPATTVLTLNGGNGTGSGRSVNFDLNSYDQTLAGLTNTTGLSLRTQRILNTGGEPVTLTINNSANFTFSGNINGTGLDLFKSGVGTQTLAGTNNYSGSTTVSEGILSLGHSLAMQNSALNTLDSVTGDSANGFRTTVTSLTIGGITGEKNLASVFTTTSGGYSGITALTLNPIADAILDYSGIIADGAAGMTLTKTGAGTQILAGSNTYTGPTTIIAGTLALGRSDVLPDLTAISIGNASLDAATFTDTVGTLDVTSTAQINLGTGAALSFADSSEIDWTGGTLTLSGTFVSGASLRFGTNSSGLTPAQLALITAPGISSFSLDANGYLVGGGYQSWASTNAPNTGSDPNADEDGDGVANAIEYILGGGIGSNDLAKLPVVSANDGNLIFTFKRDQASIDGSTMVAIEVGNDLVTWNAPPSPYAVPDTATGPVNPGVTVVKDFPEAGIDTVTLTLPQNAAPKKFIRLKVTP